MKNLINRYTKSSWKDLVSLMIKKKKNKKFPTRNGGEINKLDLNLKK